MDRMGLEKGEKAFVRSLELNSNNALCRFHYLFCQRRHDEALVQAKLGLELDPLDSLILSLYAVVMRDAGEYASAVEHFDKAYECLEELYEKGWLDVPYMASNMNGYEHFISCPGYVEILKKYDLSYPED